MLLDVNAVKLRRTRRILQITLSTWALYLLGFQYLRAPRLVAICLSECLFTLLLYAWSRRWPDEQNRVRIAHLALLAMSLGLTGNSILCGGVYGSTIPYIGSMPILAALMLGIRGTVLWTLVNSGLVWIIWQAGLRVTPEVLFRGAVLVSSQMIFVLLVAALAVVYERVTASYVRAVEQTTAELRASSRAVSEIVDNVTFGFFILGRDLLVQEQFTRSCAGFFKTEQIAGHRLREVLPQLSREDALGFEMQIQQVFDDILPPELCLGQAQHRFVVAERALCIEGRALRDDAAAIKGVLFTVSDVTDLESSQEEARYHKLLVDLLQNRESFREFVRETFAALEGAAGKLALGDEPACRLVLHTIKGNAGAHGLLRLMSVVHDIESQPSLREDDVTRVRQELRGFLLENRSVLDINPDNTVREISEVSLEQLGSLVDLISMLPAAQQRSLRSWVAAVQARPARIFLGPVEQMVQRLADRGGKLVRLEHQGLDTPVDPRRMGGVLQATQHMIRNAVDHGLELPEGRGGKPGCGTLVLDVSLTPEAYVVTVRDDGRGIDTGRLVAKALSLGLLTSQAAARLSPQETLDLIFCEGLSTANEITEISGRGVGMAAVRAAVEAVGGRLTVESALDRGTRFNAIVPIHGDTKQDGLRPG